MPRERRDYRLPPITSRMDMADGDNQWFDRLYRNARGDPTRIPWVSESACPTVSAFLADHPGPGRPAVVGCGIGDDSEAVGTAGFDTTGFDVSPEAIEWCRRRFPHSEVEYGVADLLSPPDERHHGFDLVVEVRTVQSLSPDGRPAVLDGIVSLVAPLGRLLIDALARAESVIPYGPPWAVSERELGRLATAGLEMESLETVSGGLGSDFVGVYRRP